MITKPIFGLTSPRIEYQPLSKDLLQPLSVPTPKQVTLLAPKTAGGQTLLDVKPGDTVKTGQRLLFAGSKNGYVISSVTGTITRVEPRIGDYGQAFTSISIQTEPSDIEDDQFSSVASPASMEAAVDYLMGVPGAPPLLTLSDPEAGIRAIIIHGGDPDLLVSTSQYLAYTNLEGLKSGIRILKEITGIEDVTLAMPGESMQGYGHIGATVKNIDRTYPAALPPLVMEQVTGQFPPAGKRPVDLGVCFITVEAVISLGNAFDSGRIPVEKTLTVVTKTGKQAIVTARIGTPLVDVLHTLGITTGDRDRIILGGPMTGSTVYDESHPVGPDTNAIMVQDKGDVPYVSNYPCVNCGECVRVCPTNVPVNMLVRFLEIGQYEEGADQYDLYSCIDCGLCSFVCIAKIPIFQYIRLAKHELERMRALEAANE